MTLSDLGADGLAALIGHGEDDMVERKREPPAGTRFGAAVASFANTLGGWILLGVDDDGTVHGWEAEPRKTDLQSHLGQLLRAQVDPLPPFVAAYQEVEGKPIAVMRIFESSDVPHVERGTGAIYVRTSAGKVPLDRHDAVLALAQRGRDAEREAHRRLPTSWIVQSELTPPDVDQARIARGGDPDSFVVVVRAAPLTVSPAMRDWPISGSGVAACCQLAEDLLGGVRTAPAVQPRARGVVVRKGERVGGVTGEDWHVTVAADSMGLVACELRRPARNFLQTDVLRREMIRPAIEAVCRLLDEAEAVGRAVCDMWFSSRKDMIVAIPSESNPRAMDFHVSSEISIPADEEERAAMGRRWEREIARELGEARWESEEEDRG